MRSTEHEREGEKGDIKWYPTGRSSDLGNGAIRWGVDALPHLTTVGLDVDARVEVIGPQFAEGPRKADGSIDGRTEKIEGVLAGLTKRKSHCDEEHDTGKEGRTHKFGALKL